MHQAMSLLIEDVPHLWRAQVSCPREGQTGIPPSYHSYLTLIHLSFFTSAAYKVIG